LLATPAKFSFVGLGVAAVVTGVANVIAVYVVQLFRRGLDADMGMQMAAASVSSLIAGAGIFAGFWLVLLAIAVLIANRFLATRIRAAAYPIAVIGLALMFYFGLFVTFALLSGEPQALQRMFAAKVVYQGWWAELVSWVLLSGLCGWVYGRVARLKRVRAPA